MPISSLPSLQQIGAQVSTWAENVYQFILSERPSQRRVDQQTAAAWSTQHVFGHNPCSSLKLLSIACIYTNSKSSHFRFPSRAALHNTLKKDYPEIVDIEIRLSKKLSSTTLFSSSLFLQPVSVLDRYSNIDAFKNVLEEIKYAPIPTHVKNKLLTTAVQAIPFWLFDGSLTEEDEEKIDKFLINCLKEWQSIASQQPDPSPVLNKLLQKSRKVETGIITISDFTRELYGALKIVSFIIKHIGPGKPFWDIMEECGLVIPSEYSPYDAIFPDDARSINNSKIWTPLGQAIKNKIIHAITKKAANLVGPEYPFLKVAEDLGLFIRGKWTVPNINIWMGLRVVCRAVETMNFNNSFWKVVTGWGLKDWGGLYVDKPPFGVFGKFPGKLLGKNKWAISDGCLDYLYYKVLYLTAKTTDSKDESCHILKNCIENCLLPDQILTVAPSSQRLAEAERRNLPKEFFEAAQKLDIFDEQSGHWVIPARIRNAVKLTIVAQKNLYFKNL
jgi:hypothetical protein